jgi:hypothetical protein
MADPPVPPGYELTSSVSNSGLTFGILFCLENVYTIGDYILADAKKGRSKGRIMMTLQDKAHAE